METFGFLPVPEVLMEDALRGVEVSRVFPFKYKRLGREGRGRALHTLSNGVVIQQCRQLVTPTTFVEGLNNLCI